MWVLVLSTKIARAETRLNKSPSSLQVRFGALTPLSGRCSEVVSKTEPYQLRQASSCSAGGREWVVNFYGSIAFAAPPVASYYRLAVE
jgi:hypothetical protein